MGQGTRGASFGQPDLRKRTFCRSSNRVGHSWVKLSVLSVHCTAVRYARATTEMGAADCASIWR